MYGIGTPISWLTTHGPRVDTYDISFFFLFPFSFLFSFSISFLSSSRIVCLTLRFFLLSCTHTAPILQSNFTPVSQQTRSNFVGNRAEMKAMDAVSTIGVHCPSESSSMSPEISSQPESTRQKKKRTEEKRDSVRAVQMPSPSAAPIYDEFIIVAPLKFSV
ncbi:unnamed protein product [Cuscuta europaea]|uniref:Uncharacterized protein n=1 Tax=Cuscuta europaea TaxID=41803 RepID=A0A9P0Z843_CUSEU|nr:unnamed protein product [Cuscuta europaea]